MQLFLFLFHILDQTFFYFFIFFKHSFLISVDVFTVSVNYLSKFLIES